MVVIVSKILLLLSCILLSESFGIIHHNNKLDHSRFLRQHHHDSRRRHRARARLIQQGGGSCISSRISIVSSQMSASTEQQLNSKAATVGSPPSPLPPEESSSSSFVSITSSTPRNTPTKKQKVAVIGSGAVGSYYGARLFEAGHDVQFYMRSPHHETCQQYGLRVTSVHGTVEICANDLQTFSHTHEMQAADWIVIALKSSSLTAIPSLIVPSPLLKPDNTTRILVIMNGLVEDDLIQMLKQATGQQQTNNHDNDNTNNEPLHCCRAVYGGMALICCNRLRPGHVDHSYAGLLSAGVACTRGGNGNDDNNNNAEDDDDDDEDRLAFENLWSSSTSQEIAWESNLLRGRWKKMLWNLPFNGISVAMGGITVDKIVQDVSLRQLARNIMDETIATANAEMMLQQQQQQQLEREQRHDDGKQGGKTGGGGGGYRYRYDPLTIQDKEQMMTFTDKMGIYRTSTMLDLVNRRTMEVEYLFLKPVQRAERLGVPVPHLKIILAMIQAYQRLYNLF